jgi:hypothetical protein
VCEPKNEDQELAWGRGEPASVSDTTITLWIAQREKALR